MIEVFPATAALVVCWLIACFRDPDNSVLLTIACIPFGMFAALVLPSIGGLSLLATSVLAALSVGIATLRYLSPSASQAASLNLGSPVFFFAAFTIYAIFSALVLVRVFEGDFLVFPMSRGIEGIRVDLRFPAMMAPLAPSSANFSQTTYVLLSFLFFVVSYSLLARKGVHFGERAIRIAAIVNIVLGMVDYLRLDTLLAHVRTSTYSLANHHTIGGFDRVIGGFPEPSSFGATSAAFCAYFAVAFLYRRTFRDGALALASGAFVVMSFSTSGYIAVGAFLVLLLWQGRRILYEPFDGRVLTIGLGLGALLLALGLWASMVLPRNDPVAFVFEALFLSKAESVSGLERGAWARNGLDAFLSTWGLGAGVGSLRSNGLVPVLLGSVGLPGALLLLGFLLSAFAGTAPKSPQLRSVFFASRAGAIAMLGAGFVSATGVDLGLLFATFAAIACAAKLQDGALAPHSKSTSAPSMPYGMPSHSH